MVRVKTENALVVVSLGVATCSHAGQGSNLVGSCVPFLGRSGRHGPGHTTEVQYRYADGTISSEGQLLNGLPQGYWISYHPDGTRKSEGNWSQGQLEGEWVFYDGAGRLETTLTYVEGRKDGAETQWDTTGVRLRTLPWSSDTLQGMQEGFNEQGIVVSRIPWSKGKREGVALDFAPEEGKTGRIICRRGFRDDLLRWVEEVNRFDDQGRKSGKWMTFWPNGQVRTEGPFERGLEEGCSSISAEGETWSAP